MGRRARRVPFELDDKGLEPLSAPEIEAILRGADDLILRGGRNLLVKVLRGSRMKQVLENGLDRSPVHGYFRGMSEADVLARIDWAILNGFLAIEYDGRLPLLVYTPKGWEIEKETYANELLSDFDELLDGPVAPHQMEHLKDRDRGMILLLLDKIEASGNVRYIPLLRAWREIDYKKVRQRIDQVVRRLEQTPGAG